MNIKQLLLISLYIFSAQAIEFQETTESKEVIELRELKRRFPASVSFLVKILGAQKTQQKTLLKKINPFAKNESEVLKKGLPDDLILKIINNYLWTDKVMARGSFDLVINSNDMIDYNIFDHYMTFLFNNEGNIDHMQLSLSGDHNAYLLSIGKYPTPEEDFTRNICNLLQFMDHSVLDIHTYGDSKFPILTTLRILNRTQQTFKQTRDNKYKVIAGIISLAGVTYYIAKKLRK